MDELCFDAEFIDLEDMRSMPEEVVGFDTEVIDLTGED